MPHKNYLHENSLPSPINLTTCTHTKLAGLAGSLMLNCGKAGGLLGLEKKITLKLIETFPLLLVGSDLDW